MDYPTQTRDFLQWIKYQPIEILAALQLELLAIEADVETQLADHRHHEYTKGPGPNGAPDWEYKATVKLRMNKWRLQVTTLLLENTARAFQREAKHLLDPDTYNVILEQATSTSGQATGAGASSHATRTS